MSDEVFNIEPDPGWLSLMASLPAGKDDSMWTWDESDFVPTTDQEMRRGMKEAMASFSHLLPNDDNCGCLTCRSFRDWMKG